MPNKLPKENVWDYPRPAVCEEFSGTLRAHLPSGKLLAMTQSGHRVLETSHPPCYYFPKEHILIPVIFKGEALPEAQPHSKGESLYLCENNRSTFCEWKGQACYFDLVEGDRKVNNIAWSYKQPSPDFSAINNHLSFYASRIGECWVNDERVQAQEGDFYGGWITSNLTGPFKGGPDTGGW